MNVMPDDTLDRVHVGEPQSGAQQALPFVGEQALGWTGPEQFAVIGDGLVRILDTRGAAVRVIEPFPTPRGAARGRPDRRAGRDIADRRATRRHRRGADRHRPRANDPAGRAEP